MSYIADTATAIRSNLPVDVHTPDNSDTLFLIYAVLVRTKGEEVEIEDVHDAWAAWMQVRDPAHPALVPFTELDPQVQQEDRPYLEAIRKTARDIRRESA